MKRSALSLLLLLLLTVLCAVPADAARNKKTFGWGMQAGVAITGATGNYVTQQDLDRGTENGLQAGVFGIWNATPSFSIQPNLQYVVKGFQYTSDGNVQVSEINVDMHYLELPVLAVWDFKPRSYVRPNVFAGLGIGLLLDDEMRIDLAGSGSPKRDLGNSNSVDLSVLAGARMSFPAQRDRAYLELRFQYGLTSFLGDTDATGLVITRDAADLGAPGSPDALHYLVSISAGFILE